MSPPRELLEVVMSNELCFIFNIAKQGSIFWHLGKRNQNISRREGKSKEKARERKKVKEEKGNEKTDNL